jgi:hypothetical protein
LKSDKSYYFFKTVLKLATSNIIGFEDIGYIFFSIKEEENLYDSHVIIEHGYLKKINCILFGNHDLESIAFIIYLRNAIFLNSG